MTNTTTIVAKTVSLEYTPSETCVSRGVKRGKIRGYEGGPAFYEGMRIVGGGSGTYVLATPARLTLKVRVGGMEHKIFTERLFRKLLNKKRLMKNRQEDLMATMPAVVELAPRVGRRGTPYFTLEDRCAEAWVKDALS